MSEENVEVVRRFIDAINRRDADDWAAAVAPELEFQSLFVGIEGRTYRGPESGRRYFGDLADAWDTFHVEIEETVDLGGDRVLASVRYQGRGKASRADTEAHAWGINVVRGGKVVSVQTYLNRDAALEAAGLRE
jgi:ketosteroid isomerase-like protein